MTYPDKDDMRTTLKGFAISMGVWLICAAVLIFAASLLAFSGEDPDARIGAVSQAALYASLIAAGICSGATGGRITGVIFTSLTVAAVILLAASFKPEGEASFGAVVSALLYLSVPLTVFFSGILTLFVKKSKASKPKRRNKRRR